MNRHSLVHPETQFKVKQCVVKQSGGSATHYLYITLEIWFGYRKSMHLPILYPVCRTSRCESFLFCRFIGRISRIHNVRLCFGCRWLFTSSISSSNVSEYSNDGGCKFRSVEYPSLPMKLIKCNLFLVINYFDYDKKIDKFLRSFKKLK